MILHLQLLNIVIIIPHRGASWWTFFFPSMICSVKFQPNERINGLESLPFVPLLLLFSHFSSFHSHRERRDRRAIERESDGFVIFSFGERLKELVGRRAISLGNILYIDIQRFLNRSLKYLSVSVCGRVHVSLYVSESRVYVRSRLFCLFVSAVDRRTKEHSHVSREQ